MNKNVFVSILLIICLLGMIGVTIAVVNSNEEQDGGIVYEGVSNTDYSEDFSLNNYYHAEVQKRLLSRFYEFTSTVTEKEDETFVNSINLDKAVVGIGTELHKGDKIGELGGEDFICDDEGIVLDIGQTEDFVCVVYTNQSALEFSFQFSQSQIHLISYDMQIEVKLSDGTYAKAAVNKIDYQNIEEGKLQVTFGLSGSQMIFLPGNFVQARVLIEDLGEVLCLPFSFFRDYNVVANKAFSVYYINSENEVELIRISTGEVHGEYVVLLTQISIGTGLYLKSTS